MNEEIQKTPLYTEHLAQKGKMVPFAGYSLPIQYSGITQEHQAVRTSSGLFDVSHMGELRVRGAEALTFVNYLITGDLSLVADGQALYTCACNERGTILDDLIVYRENEREILIVCNASNRSKISAHFREHALKYPGLSLVDESDDTALLALQGPRALTLLGNLDPEAGREISALPSFRFKRRELLGKRVTVARTGYTGEDGVEIFCEPGDAPMLWQALLHGANGEAATPAGLGARDTLRLEARLSLYGNEIDETTNPLEAGLAWIVKLNKSDFLGRDALLRIREAGLTRKLVGFKMTGRGVARSHYPLLDGDGVSVGICTSGCPSPSLGVAIGLGYLKTPLSAIGTPFFVDCRGKSIAAEVVSVPFYRRSQ